MDIALLTDVRFAVLNGMLFTSILLMTAEEPANVPPVFLKIWRRYRIHREMNKKRTADRRSNDFWEIDMTKLEP